MRTWIRRFRRESRAVRSDITIGSVTSDELVLRPGAFLIPDPARSGAFTLRIAATDQSYVDLHDPLRLEFDYVQRIADAIDSCFPPGVRIRVVHIGGAALTVPRYVTATRATSAQIVLEPDAELTDFVRARLPLPPRSGIKVRATDGRSGIAEIRDGAQDLVVVDAFAGPQIPPELGTLEFFDEVRRVLDPAGSLIMNITDRGLGYSRRVAAAITARFASVALCAEPATLKGRRFGNVIVVAGPSPRPFAALAERAGSGPFPYRVLHGARLTQLLAGAAPFTDADAEPSPPPPFGQSFFS